MWWYSWQIKSNVVVLFKKYKMPDWLLLPQTTNHALDRIHERVWLNKDDFIYDFYTSVFNDVYYDRMFHSYKLEWQVNIYIIAESWCVITMYEKDDEFQKSVEYKHDRVLLKHSRKSRLFWKAYNISIMDFYLLNNLTSPMAKSTQPTRVSAKFFYERCQKRWAKSISQVTEMMWISHGTLAQWVKNDSRLNFKYSKIAMDYIRWIKSLHFSKQQQEKKLSREIKLIEDIAVENEVSFIKKKQLVRHANKIYVEITPEDLDKFYKPSEVALAIDLI